MPSSSDHPLYSAGLHLDRPRASSRLRLVPSQTARADFQLTAQGCWFSGSQRSLAAKATGEQLKQVLRHAYPQASPAAGTHTRFHTSYSLIRVANKVLKIVVAMFGSVP